ncbi:ATP-binding protein [Streptomyces sp. NBC_00287]|uniref:ATP-binding protein n=1 Tax=Streptomyces sp. NBC_00287 TaxID=2975702 RepID=UPI002E2BFAF5|nr:ATP-binding protein [Streptomyces sp. NBC_00287]
MAPTNATTTGDRPPALDAEARRAVFVLRADGEAVGEARHLVLEQLKGWDVHPEDCDTAALVVSELFTNAVIHTSSQTIACRLGDTPEQLLIQIEDDGTGRSTPTPQRAHPHDEGGRGLMLVKAVSRRWGLGSSENGRGRIVWAVLRAHRARRSDHLANADERRWT